ncbi:MAG: glycosyltransferase family 4 protein [Burkholderiales bacterium]
MANQTRQLAELLQGEGVSVVVVRTNAPYGSAWIARLRGVRAGVRLLFYVRELWRAAGQVSLFHVMANSGWSWHLFAVPAIWIGRLRGIAVVVNYRGGEASSFLQRSAGLVRWGMRRASKLIVPSDYLREIFSAYGMRAEVIPNIIDLELFFPGKGERPLNPHLVVTRNLEAIYDNATALHVLARVREKFPGARLTICGEGPELEMLDAQARNLGLGRAVTFAGRMNRDQIASLLRDADVLLNPSLVDNMPNSILEALASGVPVVSTRVGGVPYIVQHEVSALLVAPGEPGEMAAAVLRLLGERDIRERLTSEGLRCVESFTWRSVRDRLESVYRGACMALQELVVETGARQK